MYVTVELDIPIESREVARIKDVQIYTGYSLNMERIDSNRPQAQYYKGYYIIDRRKRYKPSLFSETMKLNREMFIIALIIILHSVALSISIFSNL